MLAAWTWEQLAHEAGTSAAAMIAIVCLAYLTRKGASVLRNRERELLDHGIATGLTRKGARELKNRRRFSLLDLFVVVTLVAALVGFIKGTMTEDKHGMSYEYLSWWPPESDREIDGAQRKEK